MIGFEKISRKIALFRVRVLGTIRRKLGVFLLSRRKHLKVVIKKTVYEKLKNKDDFTCAIQLSRFVNSIRSSQRSYLRVRNDARIPNEKDRVDLILLQSSLLYEAVLKFFSMSKTLTKLPSWKSNQQEIQRLRNELCDKNGFFKTILKPIRNKVLFHFDGDLISETLKVFHTKKDVYFAIGESTMNKDIVFSLADDLILTYIVSKVTNGQSGKEKFEWFEKKLLHVTESFCNIATILAFDIISKHSSFKKGIL